MINLRNFSTNHVLTQNTILYFGSKLLSLDLRNTTIKENELLKHIDNL